MLEKMVKLVSNQIKKFLFILLIVSCSAQQRQHQKNTYLDCKKFNVEADTNYYGQDESTMFNMSDFNSCKTKSLDIVRILNDSGYDTTESFKRIYIENEIVFLFQNNNLKQLTVDYFKKINDVFGDLENITTMIHCEENSSRKYIYRYFVRKNGELIMSFYSNNIIVNISQDLIEKEFKYLDFFENLK